MGIMRRKPEEIVTKQTIGTCYRNDHYADGVDGSYITRRRNAP